MRILIILQRWQGGVGRYVLSVKKELEDRGHKVKVISREDDLNIYSFVKSLFYLKEIIKKEKYDILFTQDWSITLPLLFMDNLFCVFHGHNPNFLGRTAQKFISNYLGKKLVVVGDTLKERFKNSTLIYEGVDMKEFYPKNQKRKYVGVIYNRTGNYSIEDLISMFGTRLRVAKNIPHKRMNDFYNSLDLFINLPPKCTGFNLAWLEAMAAGVTYIIGNNYGIGHKLPIDKIEDHQNQLYRVMLNSKKRNYRKWLKKHKEFTWNNHVDKLLRLFTPSYHKYTNTWIKLKGG